MSSPLLIMQPVTFCNISCSYCYLPHRNSATKMHMDTVRRSAERFAESSLLDGDLPIIWHAGEPLVAGKKFFREAFSIFEDEFFRRKSFHHAIQTNATLIDDEWCEIFKLNNVRVGVSLDGPQSFHDQHRKSRSGLGTHKQCLRGLRLLQKYGIDVEIICVLSRNSIEYPNDIFSYFEQLGVRSISFNIDEPEGVNLTSTHVEDEVFRYKSFIKEIMHLQESSSSTVRVRETQGVMEALYGVVKTDKSSRLPIISVDVSGNLFAFSPELVGHSCSRLNDFCVGHVNDTPIDQIPLNKTFLAMKEEIYSGVEACKSQCEYFDLCGGGFPSWKFFEHGRFDVAETFTCKYIKKGLFDAALEYVEARSLSR